MFGDLLKLAFDEDENHTVYQVEDRRPDPLRGNSEEREREAPDVDPMERVQALLEDVNKQVQAELVEKDAIKRDRDMLRNQVRALQRQLQRLPDQAEKVEDASADEVGLQDGAGKPARHSVPAPSRESVRQGGRRTSRPGAATADPGSDADSDRKGRTSTSSDSLEDAVKDFSEAFPDDAAEADAGGGVMDGGEGGETQLVPALGGDSPAELPGVVPVRTPTGEMRPLGSLVSMTSVATIVDRPSHELKTTWILQGKSLERTAVPVVNTKTKKMFAVDEQKLSEKIQSYDGCLAKFISVPGSSKRMAWDLIGGVLILYDLLMIPLQAFPLDNSGFLHFMDWVTCVYWTLNVAASLCVGYTSNGVTVMVPRKILFNYMRTWMIVDIIVLVPDWSMRLDLGGGILGSIRLFRAFRLMRVLRLVRLLKLKWILQLLDDLLDSEGASIWVNIFKMIALLLMVNHLIACGWFAIADVQELPNTWVKFHGFEFDGWFYQYLTAYHWSMTQFTPASMHVQPQNTLERIYSIIVIIFALVGFSYVVGSITGSLTQLRALKEEGAKQFWQLRRYLRKNQVPVVLSIRIQRYVEYAWQRQAESMSANRVKILDMLSEQLMNELQSKVTVPHLEIHPLFDRINEEHEVVMQRVASTAIKRRNIACNDELFFPGETGTQMYFICSGCFIYVYSSEDEDHKETITPREDWVAEPVMWIKHWIHIGMMVAVRDSEIMSIDPSRFGECVTKNLATYRLAAKYAQRFLMWLNDSDIQRSDVVQGDIMGPEIGEWVEQAAAKEVRSPRMRQSPTTSATGGPSASVRSAKEP